MISVDCCNRNLEKNMSQVWLEIGDFRLVVAHIDSELAVAHMVRLETKFPWASIFARRRRALAVMLVDLQMIDAADDEVA